MAGPGGKDQTASTRAAEPPRPVRQTRQALKAQRAAEAVNVAADEPAASPQPMHDVVEVAANSSAANDRPTPPPRRYAAPPRPNETFSSPASNDFAPDIMESNLVTPGRVSYFPPNRPPRESIEGQEYATEGPRFEAQRAQEVIHSSGAVARQEDANQVDEDEYVSSSSESEKPIQRRPTAPRPTHFDAAHASHDMASEVVTSFEQNPRPRKNIPGTDNSRTAPSHYQKGNQNPSQYLSDARANLQMPNTPKRSNHKISSQSPSRESLLGFSQANMLKRQRTIDEKEEDENEEEDEDGFETNSRPAKQRVTGRENGGKLGSSPGSVPPPPQFVANDLQDSATIAKSSNGARANASEHQGAVGAAAQSRGFVPPPPEPVVNGRRSPASRSKPANGAEDNHSEHNQAAGARNSGDIGALEAIEVSVKARETALKYRSVTKKPQNRSPWTAGDVAKLIAAISKHGCSWSMLENELETLSTPRNQQQIRDKARNIKVDFLLGDIPLPHGFDGIALGKKEKEKVISCERNPDREEADVDENGNAINCSYSR